MDKDKMMQQAKIIQQKKIARIRQLSKSLRPTIQNKVVKFDQPVNLNPNKTGQSMPVNPPPPQILKQNTGTNLFANQSSSQQQQKPQPKPQNPPQPVKKEVRKGCGSCKRKLGGG